MSRREVLRILVHAVGEQLIREVSDEGTEPISIGPSHECAGQCLLVARNHVKTLCNRSHRPIVGNQRNKLIVTNNGPAVIFDGVHEPAECVHVVADGFRLRLMQQVHVVRRRIK